MSLFEGVGVAMITPFSVSGVNLEAVRNLTERLIAGGADALFPLGTTGEPSTMSESERESVLATVISATDGRVPVIAGCGCNDTAESVRRAKAAKNLGADGVLVVTPYYNKCTQAGLVAHYRAIAEGARVPVIAYNVPSRTGVNLLPETAVKLMEIENLVGIKEASGDVGQLQEILRLTDGRLDIYLGEDSLTYVGLALGAKGVISVAANAATGGMKEITALFSSGDLAGARQAQMRMLPLIRALFMEVNPIPIKCAMNLLGFDAGVVRLPLTAAQHETKAALEREMRELGLMN